MKPPGMHAIKDFWHLLILLNPICATSACCLQCTRGIVSEGLFSCVLHSITLRLQLAVQYQSWSVSAGFGIEHHLLNLSLSASPLSSVVQVLELCPSRAAIGPPCSSLGILVDQKQCRYPLMAWRRTQRVCCIPGCMHPAQAILPSASHASACSQCMVKSPEFWLLSHSWSRLDRLTPQSSCD